MGTYSSVVAEGLQRVSNDFTEIAKRHGFRRGKGRAWTKTNEFAEEMVRFFRHGSTYGAPRTASVNLRVILSVRPKDGAAGSGSEQLWSDHVRRPNGYAYHHRFNAETGSTYDRCLDELELFLVETAEPWFAERRKPMKGRTALDGLFPQLGAAQ